MVQHKVDRFGRPVDPRLRELEDQLQVLAGIFRGAQANPKVREETVQQYQAALQKLYDSGWDGSLDLQSELPSQYMPTRYLKRNPQWNPFETYNHEFAVRCLEQLDNQTAAGHKSGWKRAVSGLQKTLRPRTNK